MTDRLALADARYRRGDYLGAEVAAAAALADAEAAGAPPLERARVANAHGFFLYLTGRYPEARDRFEAARGTWSSELGPASGPALQALNNLAMLDDAEGDVVRARDRMAEVVALRTADGADAAARAPAAVAQAYNNLGLAEEACGDSSAARRAWERAAAVGGEGPEVEAAVVNLAGMLAELGDLDEAERHYTDVLARRVGRLGERHPEVAAVRVNAAVVARARGEAARAAERLEAALSVWRRTKGPAHPDVASLLGSLGAVYNDLERWAPARAVLQEAVGIWDAAGLAAHGEAATALNNLGVSHLWSGDAEAARSWFGRALAVREGALTPDHPALVPLLVNAARAAHEATGGGLAQARRAVALADAVAGRVLAVLSGAEQHVYAQAHLDPALSEALHVTRGGPPPPDVLGALFRRRGALAEGIRRRARLARAGEEGEALRSAAAAVAHAARTGSPSLAPLERERERLERAIGERAAAARGEGETPMVEGLWERLGSGGALVHLATSADGAGLRWLTALVLRPGRVDRVELGRVEEAVTACARWRRRRESEVDVDDLSALVWSPLRAHLGGAERAWVSAPGAFARVPWSALGAAAGVGVALAPSAHVLLRTGGPVGPCRRGVVVGDVAYGAGGHRSWEALSGMAGEGAEVGGLLRRGGVVVRGLGGEGATPGAVAEAMEQSGVAHIATHGFLEAVGGGGTGHEGQARGGWPLPDVAVRAGRSPLVTNGLALSGANAGPEGELSAEAIAGLDLRGLRLLVLSACETGHGADADEDGVVGLPAAAHAAGARAVVASLWPVPDEATRRLMRAFYGALGAGDCPARALAVAQERVRRTPGFEAAVHWAGWAVSGDAFRPVLSRV